MANGTITGKEVLDGVKEEISATNEELKKLLATYNELAKAVQNTKTPKQGNTILKKRNELDEASINLQTKLAKLAKEKANAEAAQQRALTATARAVKAKDSAEKAAIKTRSTNLAQFKSLNSAYQQQSRLLNSLRDRYKSLAVEQLKGVKLTRQQAIEFRNLGNRIRQLDRNLKKVDAASGQFNRNVGNYPKTFGIAARSIRSFAGAFGFTSGIYLWASAVKDAFNRVREFDKAMQNISGILRTTRKDLKNLEREIIAVAGASIKTSREVAGLAESLVTLGKGKEEIIDLLKPTNDLSIALETTGDKAAEFLVQTLNAFGAGSDQAAEYADVIATIRTSTTLDFQKMADSFQYLTPISNILGKDLAYTGAIIGVLADNSLKAEQGARLLGTAQQKLAKENISLVDALEQINQAQKEGVQELELLSLASNLFGKQAAKVGIILANNSDILEANAQKIRENGGALDDLVNEQLKSLDAKIKILDSTWEELILTIENGEGSTSKFFKGVVEGATGYLNELIEVEAAQSRVFEITGKSETLLGRFQKTNLFLGQINTKFENLVETQKEFNRYLSTIGKDTSLVFLEDEINSLNDAIENNNDLTDDQRELYKTQVKTIQELYDSNKLAREELEKQVLAIVEAGDGFENYGRNVKVLSSDILQDFVNANKNVLDSVASINEEFDKLDFVTINSLNAKLKELKDLRNETDVTSPLFEELKVEIKAVEKEINRLLDKAKKSAKKVLEGSEASFKKRISELEDEQSRLATTTEQYEEYADKIEEAKKQLEALVKVRENLDKLGTPNLGFVGTVKTNKDGNVSAGPENAVSKSSISQTLQNVGSFDTPEDDEFNKLLSKRETAVEESTSRQLDILKSFFEGAQELYGIDLQAFIDILGDKEFAQLTSIEKTVSIATAAQDTLLSLNDALYQATTDRLNAELEANRAVLKAVLDDDKKSKQDKESAQKAFDAKQAKIKKKQFEADQKAAKAQTIINTAVAIIQAYAQLGPIGGTIAGALITALSLVQLSNIDRQKPPQFFKGKKATDNFEGWGTWGEKRREVSVDEHGNVEISPNKTTPRYIKKKEIIVPSVPQFNREIQNPDSDIAQRVFKKYNQDTVERTNWFATSSPVHIEPLRGVISDEIKKGFKNIRIINHNKIINETPTTGYRR